MYLVGFAGGALPDFWLLVGNDLVFRRWLQGRYRAFARDFHSGIKGLQLAPRRSRRRD